jgi:hypothetical protein
MVAGITFVESSDRVPKAAFAARPEGQEGLRRGQTRASGLVVRGPAYKFEHLVVVKLFSSYQPESVSFRLCH